MPDTETQACLALEDYPHLILTGDDDTTSPEELPENTDGQLALQFSETDLPLFS